MTRTRGPGWGSLRGASGQVRGGLSVCERAGSDESVLGQFSHVLFSHVLFLAQFQGP